MIDKFRKIAAGNRIRDVIIFLQWVAMVGIILWIDYRNQQETRLCVINGTTAYIATSINAKQSQEFRLMSGKLAALAIFDRGPDDYEHWELALRVLNTATQKSLIETKLKDETTFRSMKITQTFHSSKIEETAIASDTYDMMLRGEVIRNMIEDGQPTVKTFPTRVVMRLIKNPKWDSEGRFFWVVSQLDITRI